MSKIIMHIDLNAFFATAETIKDPSLKGKPLVVAGKTKRGIVSTASYEARKYGIHSAMPTYQAMNLCPNLIVCDADFRYYHKLSQTFFEFVKTYSPIIEIASIDECFVDMTEVLLKVEDVEQYLKELQMSLLKRTGLSCSIGIGPTKFLAKMASDMKKPLGITILRKRDLPSKLWPLAIEEMFGVGKKTAPKLKNLGINTIGDLANSEDENVKKLLGKFYYTLHDWANGKGNDIVDVEPFNPKSISTSTTFLDDTNNYDQIKDMIKELSTEVAKRAKKENKLGTTVQLTIKNADFTSFTRSKSYDKPFNNVEKIYNAAMQLMETNYRSQFIRLVGVALQNLVDYKEIQVQMTLFDFEQHEEEAKTKLLINELNRKMHKDVLKRASDVKRGENNENE